MKAKHFAGLDGLRFISITFVVLHHLFTFKTNFGYTNFDYPILGLIGFYGIQFFFMGSGFLITYLLLSEDATYGKLNLRQFFMRRILRIWPGYYLLIILALVFALQADFFRIPATTDLYLQADYKKSNLFYFSFLPHLQPFFYPTGPYVHHTYTIGIEEQFYVVWGLLFYFLRGRIYYFFLALLLLAPVLNGVHFWINADPQRLQDFPLLKKVSSVLTYLHYSRFTTFAIGSLFGHAYFHQKRWISVFASRWVQVAVYVLLVVCIVTNFSMPLFEYEFMSLLMGCVMLMATFKKESIFNYSASWISYLGKISYGIYLFHIFAIVFACKLVQLVTPVETHFGITLLLCVLTLGISIVFGSVSYHYFEVYFLKLKEHFRQRSQARAKQKIRQDNLSVNEQ
jgi:peptidoglycan/LPS O-acetylase OafA/YrhL